MKRYLVLALLLSTATVKAQTAKVEELTLKLKSVTSDSLKADVYIDLHNEVFKTDLPKAEEYALGIIKYGQLAQSWKQVETGYQGLARCERKKRNYDAVIPYDLKALEFAKKTKAEGEVYLCTVQIGRDFMDADQMDQALPYLNAAAQSASKTNNPAYIAKVQQSLGYYYYKLEKHSLAIPYFKTSLNFATQAKDPYISAVTKMWMGYSLIKLKEFIGLPELIFSALDYFTEMKSAASKAACYELLGACYLGNGDAKRGISNFLEARKLYEDSQNKVQQGLVCPDLARCYLLAKDYTNAKKFITESNDIFAAADYQIGLIQVKTSWGQYYSETGELKTADRFFAEANAMLKKEPQNDLLINNETYWAAHMYRKHNPRLGDSLTYSYAKRVADTKERATILKELNALKNKNKGLDSISLADLKTLYSKGGQELLKKKYGNKSLQSMIPFMDSLSSLSPYSNATAAQDSIASERFNHVLLDRETQYRTRIKSDSLHLEQQNLASTRKELKLTNSILGLSALAGIILLLLIFTQVHFRKKSEKDKKRIGDLKTDLQHRIDNYLFIVSDVVDNAMLSGMNTPELNLFNTRIKAMTTLQQKLSRLGDDPDLNMQDYLTEIAASLKAVFDVENKVVIEVDAKVKINGFTAEPIGLIANEIITNSLKHAFKDQKDCMIHVKLSESGGGKYQLDIYDNGQGFDQDQVAKNTGLPLLEGLASQVKGSLKLDGRKGTRMLLNF